MDFYSHFLSVVIIIQHIIHGSMSQDCSKPETVGYSASRIDDGKCNISVYISLDPIMYKKQIKMTVTSMFADFVSTDMPFMAISLMYDERNLGLSNCENSNGYREITKWDIHDAFNGNGITSKTFLTTFECLSTDYLTPGNYCVVMDIVSNNQKQPCNRVIVFTKMTELTDPPDPRTSLSTTMTSSNYQTYTIVFSVLLTVCIIGTVVFFLIKRGFGVQYIYDQKRSGALKSQQKMFKDILSKSAVRVVILYFPDCSHHMKVVENLAAFLTCNRCLVSYDAIEKDLMATNPVSWLDQKLNGDHKILIVNSRGAFACQKRWLNRGKFTDDLDDNSTFLWALASIMPRPTTAFDYSRLYMLRPAYVPSEQLLTGITTNRHYEFPANLSTLLCHLHELDSSWASERGGGDEWEHCLSAYSNLRGAVDQLARADGLCRQCETEAVKC